MYSVMIMKGLSVQKKAPKIGKNTKKYPSYPPQKVTLLKSLNLPQALPKFLNPQMPNAPQKNPTPQNNPNPAKIAKNPNHPQKSKPSQFPQKPQTPDSPKNDLC